MGGFDPFDGDYLEQLSGFLAATGSPWHSEHLCFSSVDGSATHALQPMPMMLRVPLDRLVQAQRASIGRVARDLGLAGPGEALELLARFRAQGAIRGFRP